MKKLIFLLTAFLLCGCSQNKVAVTELTAVATSTSVSEAVTTVSSETTASLTTTVAEASREETTVLTAISEASELSETATEPPEDTTVSETEKNSETTVSIKPIPLNTTEAETYIDDGPNPGAGWHPKNDIILFGEHYAPYFSGLFKKENGKFYFYNFDESRKIFFEGENGDIELKNYLFGRESEYMYDIINNYEPVGTAVYREEAINDFETNMEELDGTQIYFFEEYYPEDEPDKLKRLKFLMVGTEPFITLDGVDLYVYTTDFGDYIM
ncbi:MAG: hypothetical protein J6B08_05335 [Ruminiclostridium sp.]|nr:hypothetical protein [Ruminiclostridium sp.]